VPPACASTTCSFNMYMERRRRRRRASPKYPAFVSPVTHSDECKSHTLIAMIVDAKCEYQYGHTPSIQHNDFVIICTTRISQIAAPSWTSVQCWPRKLLRYHGPKERLQ